MLFKIVAFKANYLSQRHCQRIFLRSNYVPNTISFRLRLGRGVQRFRGSPGQTFYAPVTLTTLPNTVMYSLQFNVTVNTGGPNPGPALATRRRRLVSSPC